MYKILLCLRYLRTRYIALASIISVMLGVATMIVVNSVMAGFSTEMRERIHGILADVIAETTTLDGTYDPQKQMAIIRKAVGDDIESMTATVEIYGMLSFEFGGQWITRPITLIGIKPEEKALVGPLVSYLDSYSALRENGKIVRSPLRSQNVPAGWTLTAQAQTYRREWTDRQRWRLEQLYDHREPDNSPDANPFDQFDPKATGTSPTTTDRDTTASENPFSPKTKHRKRKAESGKRKAGRGPAAKEEPIDPAEPLEGRIYIGRGLISFLYKDPLTGKTATRMMARPGDDVAISTVSAGRPPEARHFNATIVDVFKSGMSEYDSNLIFCNIEYLQKIRGMVDPTTGSRAITSIQIKLKDYTHSKDVVERLRAAFPPGMFTVRTWEQKQGPLLAAVDVEAAILNVLLFLIIAVAGFGILAIFYMIVVEKTRDIGILKALGASSRGVMSIFLSYGLGLGVVGSGVGVGLGLTFVFYINEIESLITAITGRKVFDEKIYYFPSIPTDVHAGMVFWVAFGAIVIAVLASILPARRASRLHPVEALRFE